MTELLGGKHPALLQTFHPWGNSLNQAYERWRETGTRPILHISTADDQTLAELITPQQIALGVGDDYLLQLNDFFAKPRPARLHPAAGRAQPLPQRLVGGQLRRQPERRRTHDRLVQAGVPPNRRDRAGRQHLEGINATLAEIGLPPLQPHQRPAADRSLPAAPVSIIWSPLPGGSPRVKGNFPATTGRGSRWVDWVGTDFYSQYPVWKDLNRFFTASSGGASRSRSPSGRSTAKTNRASPTAGRLGRPSATACGCSSTTRLRQQLQPLRPEALPAHREHSALEGPAGDFPNRS